ncbi:MAG: transglutaminase family protein [Desulfobacteraceae bacterium]|nr:MAG: transglutaminase family protein [Desulfobacteraceae bacterium]
MNANFPQYLQATEVINFHHPAVAAFIKERIDGATTPQQQAVKLYYAVRDEIRYDPYTINLSVDGLRASTTLQTGRGWCVPKAALLAACCRALGIPAKLGYADVRNHLSTARMRENMKTDIFLWHGYTSIYLDTQWVKATPAFNIGLCERFQLKPLEFDGSCDSLYHPFDLRGNKHMEYLRERGEFADVPIDQISRDFAQTYTTPEHLGAFDFQQDVDRENPLKR